VTLTREELSARPLVSVAEAAAWCGIPERSFRAQLAPGGDLEHVGVRVGRRVFVRTSALLAWAGVPPNDGTG
jgi:hypothetical protein